MKALIQALPSEKEFYETLDNFGSDEQTAKEYLDSISKKVAAARAAYDALSEEEVPLIDAQLTEFLEMWQATIEAFTETALFAEDYASEVKNALVAGGEVVLSQNVSFAENIIIPSGTEAVLDLNGFTFTDSKVLAVFGDLTVTGESGRMESTIQVGTYNSTGLATDGATFTLDGDVTLYFSDAGIGVFGDNSEVNVKRGTIDASYFSIAGNGTPTRTNNSKINIAGGKVIARDDVAIYHPQHNGEVHITGGMVKGDWAAIQMCAGSLYVSGDDTEIEATSEKDWPQKNDSTSDGSLNDGAAISIINRKGYGALGEIDISGGTIKAAGSPIKYYGAATNNGTVTMKLENAATLEKFSISGGTFIGGVSEPAVRDYYAEGKEDGETVNEDAILSNYAEVTGGVFSSNVSSLLKEDSGYLCAQNAKGRYEVFPKEEAEFWLTKDGSKITERIQLDINTEAEASKKSVTIAVSDEMYGDFLWKVDKEDIIDLSDTTGNEITLTAKKAGIAKITVKSELLKKEVTLELSVIDSSIKAEVGEKAPEIKTSVTSDSVDSPDVDVELTEEQEADLESKKTALIQSVTADLLTNSGASEYAISVDKDKLAAAMADKLKDGTKLVVGTTQELSGIELDSVINYQKNADGSDELDENGNKIVLSVTPVIRSLTYQIDMIYEIEDSAGNTLDSDGYNPQKQFKVTFRIPIPSVVREKYAIVTHKSSEGDEVSRHLIHRADGGSGYVEITVDHFSEFVLEFTDEEENASTGSNGSSGSGGSRGSSAAGKRYDSKKGWVSYTQGIITGEGSGYSKWQSEQTADGSIKWKLIYADGTMAAGTIQTRADGTTYEQPAWEKVNGAWYPFGVDGIVKSGWVQDEQLGGIFFIDINKGMMTGWQLIDNKWYYFNPVSDGTMGILRVNTWIDGWFVGADGSWDQKPQAVNQ